MCARATSTAPTLIVVYVLILMWQTLILHEVVSHITYKDNAELLRTKFVKHEGKKVLHILFNLSC